MRIVPEVFRRCAKRTTRKPNSIASGFNYFQTMLEITDTTTFLAVLPLHA
jgi:hypothetical protein